MAIPQVRYSWPSKGYFPSDAVVLLDCECPCKEFSLRKGWNVNHGWLPRETFSILFMEGDLYGSKKWWGRIGVIHSNHVGGDSPVCFKTKKAKVVNHDFLRALLFQVELFLFFSRKFLYITVLDDLAKQKPAWQSSMYEYNPASNAVDGKRLTTLAEGSCSHTNYEYSPWLTVDLRAKYKVTEVVITNRGDCCCEFICLSCCIYYCLKI